MTRPATQDARRGIPPPLEPAAVDPIVRGALVEDLGRDPTSGGGEALGDLTTDSAVPAGARARGRLIAKSPGVLAGLGVFLRVFELLDPDVRVEARAADGDAVEPGQVVCTLEGRARTLLVGERTALNLLQRMSGTATLTRRYVDAAAGGARVLDTRKTTPGLRVLEKYAMRCGGGENHRFGLFDEVMVKDNHADLAGRDLGTVVREVRAAVGADVRLTSEARDEAEALAGIAGGADVILLDNMSPDALRELCPRLRAAAAEAGRAVELEASGGIDLTTIAAFARTGVDRISVGALTHSAPALDLSLKLERLP